MGTIDPAYYTVADGDGHTKAARDAAVNVGGDPRPVAEWARDPNKLRVFQLADALVLNIYQATKAFPPGSGMAYRPRPAAHRFRAPPISLKDVRGDRSASISVS